MNKTDQIMELVQEALISKFQSGEVKASDISAAVQFLRLFHKNARLNEAEEREAELIAEGNKALKELMDRAKANAK